MKSRLFKILTYILTALLSCALTLTVVMLLRPEESKLTELENLIENQFIGDVDVDVLRDAAADAMVQAMGDRWSYYMTEEEYESYKEQMANSYVGIGVTVELDPQGRGAKVIQVAAGGPAEAAGILPEDVIVQVEGENCAGIPLADMSSLIRGEAGTKVSITVLRGEESLDISVERKSIRTAVATGEMLPGNIGLVRIVNFDSRCCDETVAAIEELIGQGAEKLIFDVRYNPGGYKAQLVQLLNYLLPEGLLFRSEYYDGTVQDDESDERCLEMPMAVLVNGSSYSAAEFFAAALRDYDWAVTVGEQTCGKGYFQNTYALSDGSAACISVGKYYTPKGVSLAEVGGLTPDVVVEVDDETAAAIYAGTIDPMEDPQILAAIEALKEE